MKKYICVAPDKEAFDINGKSLGMQGERALYYSKDIGKHRIYRNSYPSITPFIFNGKNINEKLKLFYFNNIPDAEKLCVEINNAYGDNFEVREVEVNE